MTDTQRDKAWFEMRDVIRPRLAASMWVPLHVSEDRRKGRHGRPGYESDLNAIRSLAVPLSNRAEGDKLTFNELSQGYRSSAWDSEYSPVDEYQLGDGPRGVHLALVQSFSGPEDAVWSLNQDLVFALELVREGDQWIRPAEGYAVVAELRRNSEGKPHGLYIRPEFLRDYLAARSMALRIVQFRQRLAVVDDVAPIGWTNAPAVEMVEGGKFEGRAWPIGGDTVAVFTVRRTDVWGEDEVPVLGRSTDDNTTGESHSFRRPSTNLHFAEGEFRREEWFEPGSASPRVRYDDPPSGVTFAVDPAGKRASSNDLKSEEIGLWLWFKPDVIPAILRIRGSSLEWHTATTGTVRPTPTDHLHFGINERDLVVVYAYDVARQDEWLRVIWAGFNVAPDGPLPPELHASQVRAEPAETLAPEAYFASGLQALDDAVQGRWGHPLFREHAKADDIISSVHRFRSLDEDGFLALAKDIARATAERIDAGRLAATIGLKEKAGSLKTLEKALATIIDPADARAAMSVLVGAYDLRGADAHLPSSQLADAFELAEVDPTASPLEKGTMLLHRVVEAIYGLAELISSKSR